MASEPAMAGALLRSGNLREFKPLGAVGSPVYSAAVQLRAAVRRQLGDAAADLFAIPRLYDDGDRIDWYAPRAGDVIPWSAATPEQRTAAKATLVAARERLAEHSRALQADERGERQVFGRLLAQATEIPGDEHIYIVSGQPVLTFWGFHPAAAPSGFDVVGNLDTQTAPPAAAPRPPLSPPTVAAAPTHRSWWWLWLLLLLLLLLLLALLRQCANEVPDRTRPGGLAPLDLPTPTPTPVAPAAGTTIAHEAGVGVGGRPVDDAGAMPAAPGAAPGQGVLTPAAGAEATALPGEPPPGAGAAPPASPPLPSDDHAPPPAGPTSPQATAPAGAPDTPPPVVPPDAASPDRPEDAPRPGGAPAPSGTPLTIPKQAVDANSTEFLNGKWRSITGLQDRKGNPVELNYDFEKGEGTVSLRRSVGGQEQTCTGRVGSTLKDGRLQIDQADIRCPDGSSFQDSAVRCTVGADGKAVCTGINTDGTTYDVNIVR